MPRLSIYQDSVHAVRIDLPFPPDTLFLGAAYAVLRVYLLEHQALHRLCARTFPDSMQFFPIGSVDQRSQYEALGINTCYRFLEQGATLMLSYPTHIPPVVFQQIECHEHGRQLAQHPGRQCLAANALLQVCERRWLPVFPYQNLTIQYCAIGQQDAAYFGETICNEIFTTRP